MGKCTARTASGIYNNQPKLVNIRQPKLKRKDENGGFLGLYTRQINLAVSDEENDVEGEESVMITSFSFSIFSVPLRFLIFRFKGWGYTRIQPDKRDGDRRRGQL